MLTPCNEWRERLAAFLDGEGSTTDTTQIVDHLAQCPTCRAYAELARCDAQDVAAALCAPQAGPGFAARVMAQIAVTPMDTAPETPPAPQARQSFWKKQLFPGFGRVVEALTVIALVAVVGSIFFPVFAKAREKSRQTTCLSNVRQMATAIAMYQQDHHGQFPAASNWVLALKDNGVSEKMFLCPISSSVPPAVDYSYNAALTGKSDRDIDFPSEYPTLWCSRFNHVGTIMGFADGHAKYIPGVKSIDDFRRQQLADLDTAVDMRKKPLEASPSGHAAETPPSSGAPAPRTTMSAVEVSGTAQPVENERHALAVVVPPTPTVMPPAKNYGLADKLQIAYTVDVSIESDDVKAATEKAEALLNQRDGFVLSSSYQRGEEQQPASASVSGRVPGEKLGVLLVDLDRLGTLVSRTVNGEDLTATHLAHLETLDSLRGAQGWLEKIEGNAKRTPDALNAESRRNDVSQQAAGTRVDEYKLKLRVTLADITIHITGKQPPPVSVNPFQKSTTDSLRALGAFSTGLGALLLAILVWIPLWGPLLVIALYLRKRYLMK